MGAVPLLALEPEKELSPSTLYRLYAGWKSRYYQDGAVLQQNTLQSKVEIV